MTIVVAPVHKTLRLTCTPERAFSMFTNEIHSWWPRATHSVFGDDAVSVVFEATEGGRVYETSSGGEQNVWGVVSAWEPPRRAVFSWSPGKDKSVKTEVEIRFTADGDGTRFELIHRGWERWAKKGQAYRDGYDGGWVGVLERFEAATSS